MVGEGLKKALRHDADMRECRARLKRGSRSFYAASLLLPGDLRQPVTALYAFCRVADDAIDGAEDPRLGLAMLRQRLAGIYAGEPGNSPVDRAFAHVVARRAIPYTLPLALLEGFEWDVEGRRYSTLSDTYAYCARVAGTVGVMMAMLMGVRNQAVLSRACDLGVAMQLTNIARDVGEDARLGRLYLPAERLRANGVDPDRWLASPQIEEGIRRTTAEMIDAADSLYRRSEWGICQLPFAVRPGIFAARYIYADIGRAVAAQQFDAVSRRAWVDRRRKLVLLATAVRMAAKTWHEDEAPPLRETRFLLDAVAQQG